MHAIVLAGDDGAVTAAAEFPFAASLGLPVALSSCRIQLLDPTASHCVRRT